MWRGGAVGNKEVEPFALDLHSRRLGVLILPLDIESLSQFMGMQIDWRRE